MAQASVDATVLTSTGEPSRGQPAGGHSSSSGQPQNRRVPVCRCGHPYCRFSDNEYHVRLPPMGTELPWSQPTLLNGSVIASTLFPGLHPSLKSPQCKSPSRYQARSKRPRLPILEIRTSAPGKGDKITCAPLPGQTIRLVEVLAVGSDVVSVVFLCTIQPAGHPAVLKLLLDQRDKLPSDTHVPEDVYGTTFNPRLDNLGLSAQMDLSNEADRFKDLASLQEHYVPWSYGFYEFTLPDSPSVVGHLMEFVPSVDVASYFSVVVKADAELVDRFFTALYRAYIEIHRHDVAHRDIGLRNIRLLPELNLDFQFVLVDLTTSGSISYTDKHGHNGLGADTTLMKVNLGEELDEDILYDWLDTSNGKHMEALFAMRTQQLAVADP